MKALDRHPEDWRKSRIVLNGPKYPTMWYVKFQFFEPELWFWVDTSGSWTFRILRMSTRNFADALYFLLRGVPRVFLACRLSVIKLSTNVESWVKLWEFPKRRRPKSVSTDTQNKRALIRRTPQTWNPKKQPYQSSGKVESGVL